MWSRPAVLALLVASGAGCSDDPAQPGPAPNPVPLQAETCSAARTLHAGAVGSQTWRAADNPHAIVDTLHVSGILTLEAGVEVCVEPDVPILVGNDGAALLVAGTASDSVVFTAGDPARPWGGILLPGECTGPSFFSEPCTAGATRLEHARIEHAMHGIVGGTAAAVISSHIRQVRCTGASASYIAHTRVDTAGIDGCPAVQMGQAAGIGREDVFIGNRITGSGGPGLYFYDDHIPTSGVVIGRISLLGGHIEGSRGIGLVFAQTYRGGLVGSAPLRITGGEQAAFAGPWEKFSALWPTAAALDSLRGNGADSVLVWDVNGADDHLTIPTGFTFVLLTAPPSGQPWAELQSVEARPGATIDSRTPVFIGSIVAEGTPGDPVRIRGNIALGCGVRMTDCDGSSRFTHSEMQDVQLNAGTPIRLDSVVIRRGSLFLSDTARLARVVLEDAGYDAIAISGTSHFTTITDCRIARSGGAGITVFENATNVTVRDCAIEQNAGPGIQNHAADSVDARFNWWGDTGGPLGPAGDGVEGNVDYREHLIAPPGEAVARAAGSGRRCGAGSCRSSSSILSAASDTPRTGPYLGVCRRIRYPSSCRYQPLTPGSGFLKSTRHTPPSRTGSSAMR